MRSSTMYAMAAATALLVPASAEGATLSFLQGARPVFLAERGESNDLSVSLDRNLLRFSDAGAPIMLVGTPTPGGPWCYPDAGQIACEGYAADAHLDDGDDRARVYAPSTARVWGGTGDDDIVAWGGGSRAEAYGEEGDDRLVGSGEGGVVDGGSGDDVVWGSWVSDGVFGGPGDDELHLTPYNFSQGNLDGGHGDDRIYAGTPALGGRIAGGNGADYIVMQGEGSWPRNGDWTVDAGRGDDTISAGPGDDTIHGGQGDDEVDVVSRGTDTVTCGPGRDAVRADPTDVIAADCEIRLSMTDGGQGDDGTDAVFRGTDPEICRPGRDAVHADASDVIAADCEIRLRR